MLTVLARKQAPAAVRAANMRAHSRSIMTTRGAMTRLHAHASAAAAAAAPSSAAPARAFPVFTPSRSFARSSRDDAAEDDDVLGGSVMSDPNSTGGVQLTPAEAAQARQALLEEMALTEAEDFEALPEDDPTAFPEDSYRQERAEQILRDRKEEEREMEDWDFNRDGPRANRNPAKLFDNSAVGRIRRGLPPLPEDALQDDMGVDDDEVDAMSPQPEGRDDDVMADINDDADEVEEEDPTHVADGVNVFEETRIDKFGKPKKVFVDRNAKPLRHKVGIDMRHARHFFLSLFSSLSVPVSAAVSSS
jgi:hypothetical protein